MVIVSLGGVNLPKAESYIQQGDDPEQGSGSGGGPNIEDDDDDRNDASGSGFGNTDGNFCFVFFSFAALLFTVYLHYMLLPEILTTFKSSFCLCFPHNNY